MPDTSANHPQEDVINQKDVEKLRDIILASAKQLQPRSTSDGEVEGRYRCAAKFVLDQLVGMGKISNRRIIELAEIIQACPGKQDVFNEDSTPARTTKDTARGMMREVTLRISHFFNEEPIGMAQRYSVEFVNTKKRGNYLPVLRDRQSSIRPDDFVGHFWQPHRSYPHPTAILYAQPQFFIDPQGTYIRNPGCNTPEQAAELMGISGPLKTSYSYVPSGIVQALLRVMEILRPSHLDKGNNNYPTVSTIKHSTEVLPNENNLVVLATPTSTPLVSILEDGLIMRTTNFGVSLNNDEKPLEDSSDALGDTVDMEKWGVLTRRPTKFKNRILTLLSARHGRTVQAMAEFLTDPNRIPKLPVQLQHQKFPESFQALFRVEMKKTPEGPEIKDVQVELAVTLET